MDANEVVKNLWVGAAPLPEDVDELNSFDCVVFSAKDYQPSPMVGFKRTAILCGIRDAHITEREKQRVLACAKMVANRLFKGDKVLCTCISGWNRSSLVAALALKMVSRYSTNEIIDLIREARGPNALSNWTFVGFLGEQSAF